MCFITCESNNRVSVQLLVQVIPEFQRTLFVDYQQLKYNETEPVNEDCDSMYWSLFKHDMGVENFFYEYLLMNQIPCPYGPCHYLNTTECPAFKMFKVSFEHGYRLNMRTMH